MRLVLAQCQTVVRHVQMYYVVPAGYSLIFLQTSRGMDTVFLVQLVYILSLR